ncbi:hypothetical protein [Sulfitobacter sp. MF3-043]|uniref:hypothetical protein n=1 Tax=Sulfitobacter sediminivivens TaxID=3252902 RepID=UPI0036DF5EB2
MSDVWELAAIATKFALYLGVLIAADTIIAALLFRPKRYRGLCLSFAILGLLAAGLSFSLRGANLAGDPSGMTDPEMLGHLWITPVGTVLIYLVAGLAAANKLRFIPALQANDPIAARHLTKSIFIE